MSVVEQFREKIKYLDRRHSPLQFDDQFVLLAHLLLELVVLLLIELQKLFDRLVATSLAQMCAEFRAIAAVVAAVLLVQTVDLDQRTLALQVVFELFALE